jgi:hypothetical protein
MATLGTIYFVRRQGWHGFGGMQYTSVCSLLSPKGKAHQI